MNTLRLPPDHEIRVELIRLYPGQEDHKILCQLQEEVRACTNHIVRSREDVKSARKAFALKNGIGGPTPQMPETPKLPTPTTPEEKTLVREAWSTHRQQVKATWPEWAKWYKAVDAEIKDLSEMSWRKDTYQLLRQLYGDIANAVLFRDTVKRVAKTPRANYKRRSDHVPLVWGNSAPVETGSFYGERRGVPWYNALIRVNGMSIPGRLRRPLPGKPVQGVTLSCKPDGWYAAVKCIVPVRQLPEPILDAIGVDVGQTDLVALSDGYTQHNPRDSEYVAKIAAIQALGDRAEDANVQQDCRNQAARLHQSRRRWIQNWLNSDLLPRLMKHSLVFIEKLAKGFKSDKGPLSCMHVILDAIKSSLKDRVREVRCAFTSQECSHCGSVNKSARKGKVYSCINESCGAVLDADTNASRVIRSRGLMLQGS
jgi:transposase